MSPQSNLISIVDDDQSMSLMLRRVMSAFGFEVASFSSAEEFLDSGILDESACLILDVDLPGMSGVDLQRELNDSGSRIPTIFISGQADEATKQVAMQAGASGFFCKPFRIDALLTTLRTVNLSSAEKRLLV
jgi:FixJ family two-component response regulator